MKRLRNHLIGVERGSTRLFSDFDSQGPMWTGTGPRQVVTPVRFSQAFRTAPVVHVTPDMVDMDQATNQRWDIAARNVTRAGFEIVFKTWADSRIARVRAGWLAIGELNDPDQWDLDEDAAAEGGSGGGS